MTELLDRRHQRPNNRGVGRGPFALAVLAFWAVPNGPSAWWHDRHYDLCMVTIADDLDWECEHVLPAIGE